MSNQNIINLKQEEVKKIAEKMSNAKSVVVAEYQGLTVEKTEELRRLLRDAECEILVIKNNISRRAAEEVGYGDLTQDLKGPNGVIFAYEDSVSAAKVLHTFAKKNRKLKIKSGVVDGNFFNQDQIKEIAQLPGKEALLTMLAVQLLTPLRELAVGLDMLTKKEETVESN
jgi:large subunit ribosomal protein L10